MGGGGADDGQAHPDRGDIGAGLELARDIHLVVIHADDAIKIAIEGALEDDIGGHGSADVDVGRLSRRNGGRDDVDFFAAEEAAFAGVRVEGGAGDARRGVAEFSEDAVQALDVATDALER